ncbi:mamo (predicted) [Pycnogonum litorale]
MGNAKQQFSLKWNNHHDNMITLFDDILLNETFADVTLACQGMVIKAHKIVLSVCSPFFKELFLGNPCQHPIVFMNDVSVSNLQAIIQFMYKGEVNISKDQLPSLLRTADALSIKGLAEVTGNLINQSDVPSSTRSKTARKRRFSDSDLGKIDCIKRNDLLANSLECTTSDESARLNDNTEECKQNVCFYDSENEIGDADTKRNQSTPDVFTDKICSPRPGSPVGVDASIIANMKMSPMSKEDSDNATYPDPYQFLEQRFSCPAMKTPTKQEDHTLSEASCSQLAPSASSCSHSKSYHYPVHLPGLTNLHSPIPSQMYSSYAMYQTSTNRCPNIPTVSTVNMTAMDISISEISSAVDTLPRERRTRGGRQVQWTPEHLKNAMTAVLKNRHGVTAAARMYGIPQPTLSCYIAKYNKLHGNIKSKCQQSNVFSELDPASATADHKPNPLSSNVVFPESSNITSTSFI